MLLQAFRDAKAKVGGDPVKAWAEVTGNPETARRYKRARGKGGLVRASWDEAAEIVAAAHVHSIKEYGPDRIAGFSPIPAMSMVSHGAGSRFVTMLGGSMLSFYDWYADLPVASPQVFGDQTDVPESADWWNSTYCIMWGSNIPVTRTPDAHFMAEARYRGQKVITVSPDYADNTKFADEWLAVHPGTDGALAIGMGHTILKEFLVERRTPRFVDYMKKFTDSAYLVSLVPRPGRGKDGGSDAAGSPRYVPGKFVTAADLPEHEGLANADFKTVLLDADGTVVVPDGSLGHRYGAADVGHWNLDLGDVDPALSVADVPGAADGGPRTAAIELPGSTSSPRAARTRRPVTPAAPARSSEASRSARSAAGSSRRSSTCCSPSTASSAPTSTSRAPGRPATTTRTRRARPRGRSSSRASTPRRRRGSGGSSPRTPRTPTDAR
ncbi:hypothetical protein GCM10025865_16960 [Paraoerskovia sediminicola]|uniref:Molybdopterin oxidoreductase domain-containing protein n=1 Tax=Paraoerskovia sediminicola TaxID=1138587 RepID=A0ABN6XBP9_9CELL|nr:hypothetical protein GCM10025865_16960 [Paraoerskovia sediminicola]